MKKTKKQSNKTLPSIGNVSKSSVTNIRMPFTGWLVYSIWDRGCEFESEDGEDTYLEFC